MNSSKKTYLFYTLQILLSMTGIFLSFYLLSEHTRLEMGLQLESGAESSWCQIGENFNCKAVQGSSYSKLFGIPVATLGCLFYFALFLLYLLCPPKNSRFAFAQKLALTLASFGILFDLYLGFAQAFSIRHFCIMCLMTYLVTATLWILTYLLIPKANFKDKFKFSSALKKAKFTAGFYFGIVGLGTIFLICLYVIPDSIQSKSTKSKSKSQSPTEVFFKVFPTLPKRNIPVQAHNPTLGKSSSAIKLIVFSDFECPHCKKAAGILHELYKDYKDSIYLVFKNYPLDMKCNANMKSSMHKHACTLAHLGICANKAGKFWDYHDQVFLEFGEISTEPTENYEPLKKLMNQYYKGNSKKWLECMKDKNTLTAIQQDLKLGDDLEIRGTPSIFINGKKVDIGPSYSNLKSLIEMELRN